MIRDLEATKFLSGYSENVRKNGLLLREVIFESLPGIIEQLDLPAKMISYCYGQKYIEMVCTIIPSNKGLKLGFYKGIDLPDPEKMLEGTGKISRFVVIKSVNQIRSAAIKNLLEDALIAYKQRMLKI